MSALAHFALGIGGAAGLMLLWVHVQQRWVDAFASGERDALAARRGDDGECNTGCAACDSREHCATSSHKGS